MVDRHRRTHVEEEGGKHNGKQTQGGEIHTNKINRATLSPFVLGCCHGSKRQGAANRCDGGEGVPGAGPRVNRRLLSNSRRMARRELSNLGAGLWGSWLGLRWKNNLEGMRNRMTISSHARRTSLLGKAVRELVGQREVLLRPGHGGTLPGGKKNHRDNRFGIINTWLSFFIPNEKNIKNEAMRVHSSKRAGEITKKKFNREKNSN